MKPERKLRWQHAAVSDLEEIHGYLSRENAEAARQFAVTVLEVALVPIFRA